MDSRTELPGGTYWQSLSADELSYYSNRQTVTSRLHHFRVPASTDTVIYPGIGHNQETSLKE